MTLRRNWDLVRLRLRRAYGIVNYSLDWYEDSEGGHCGRIG